MTADSQTRWKDLALKDLGLTSHKLTLLSHTWPPLIGTPDKPTVLPAGTHTYAFQALLPGPTAETVEAIPEASIQYVLTATLNRGKLSRHLHAYKPVRIIRTAAPDVQLGRSVENTWLGKVDYQISISESVVPFGGCLRLRMLCIPLAKGLEVGDVHVTLVETRECYIQTNHKRHRAERNVEEWQFQVSREDDWQARIEDTEQDGWLVTKRLDLPRSLNQCIQSLSLHGIKVEHKITVKVQLRNSDEHRSQVYHLPSPNPSLIVLAPCIPPNHALHIPAHIPRRAGNASRQWRRRCLSPRIRRPRPRSALRRHY